MKCTSLSLLLVILVLFSTAQTLPNSPSTQKRTLQTDRGDKGWPRSFAEGTTEFIIYQPQVEKWDGNRIYLYSAVEMKTGKNAASHYGVVSFIARTEVDKINRLVTLDDVEISGVHFPAAQDQDARLLSLLQSKLPAKARIISLDRIQAAVEAASPTIEGVKVKNDPPRIIFSTKPSILVTIDGEPKIVPVQDTELRRVLNTSAILLYETDKEKYYLRVMDWWLETKSLDGPWVRAKKLPGDMKKAEELIVAQSKGQTLQYEQPTAASGSDVKDAKQASLKKSNEVEIPVIYVVYAPSELIETRGEPQYRKIQGTEIEYVENTKATLLRFGGEHYILISGRWFKGPALVGPWTFVDREGLPAAFASIPVNSPKASALASVPGTPQAEEGLIANSIPQTATITRSEAKLTVVYDGQPIFFQIEGTSLMYARNTSAPVIKASEKYYSVESGVWFSSSNSQGPWIVADSVPSEIYTIPPSSPLYYVTYAKVYGSTDDVVYVGYSPGYYGTVVSSSTMTVVYGTGWYYPPYVGLGTWYGYPYTYGVGAGFDWSSEAGWSFGFGFGYSYGYYYPYYPWWGPMGWYGCCWYPYYGWGAWGGAAVTNVYGRWGNTAYSRTAATWANPYTGNYGAASRGATYNAQTGRVASGGRGYNTNIYTGNTAGYRGGAVYDPQTGIVAGAGAGFAGNVYTGQGAAGRGGFAYNTNTNAGVAAGKNNIYAGKDGTVYRYDRNTGGWSQNSGNGWQPSSAPGDRPTPTLQRQQEARSQGAQRSQNFNSMRSSGFSRSGGMRMGGGRRR